MNIRVFSFHRISQEVDELWQPLYPERFKRILEYIVTNYKVVNLDQFLLSDRHEPADRPYAGITFDDGYKDILTHAYPMIQEYNLPFNIFVVTNCVDTGIPPWTFVLDYMFVHTSVMENKVRDLLPPKFQTPVWNSVKDRIEFARKLKPFLKNSANDFREKVVKAYTECFRDVVMPPDLLLNWDELVYIKERGVNISSHSHTHPLLGKMEQESAIVAEFQTSYDILTRRMGQAPISISYPVGSVDERVKRIAREVGYKVGFAVNQEEYNSDKQDIFEIPRIELYNESMIKTRLRANGTLQNIKKFLPLTSNHNYYH